MLVSGDRLCLSFSALLLGCTAQDLRPVSQPAGTPSRQAAVAHVAPHARPAMPPGTVLVARITRPDLVIQQGGAIVGMSKTWTELVEEELAGLESVADPAAPADCLVALRRAANGDVEEPSVLFSVGLRSLDAGIAFARKQAGAKQAGERWYFERDTQHEVCAVARAEGPAPARLVCAEHRETMDTSLSYMTEALPLEKLGSGPGVALEFRAGPTRQLFQPELAKLRDPSLFTESLLATDRGVDAAARELLRDLAGEAAALADELDSVSAELRLDDETQSLHLSLAGKLQGATSWTSRFVADASERSCRPPSFYWDLPADSQQASFYCQLNPTEFGVLRHRVGNFVQAALEAKQVSRQLRTQVRRTTADAMTLPATFVVAKGSVPELTSGRLCASAMEVRKTLGWTIIGVDQPSEPYTAYFRGVRSLLNSREFLTLLDLDPNEARQQPVAEPADAEHRARPADVHGLWGAAQVGARNQVAGAVARFRKVLPDPEAPPEKKVETRRGAVRPPPVLLTVVERKPQGKKLPSGSVAFELDVPDGWFNAVEPAKAGRTRRLKVSVIVVPDDDPNGTRTWIGVSADEATLTAKLASVVAHQSRPLEARADLEVLKRRDSMSGGFVDLREALEPAQRPLVGSKGLPLYYSVTGTAAKDGPVLAVDTQMRVDTVRMLIPNLAD